MKTVYSRRWLVAAGILSFAAFPCHVVFAQKASLPPAQNSGAPSGKLEEVVELSPFVVQSTDETGYVATSSLVGTRTRTELKDIASQIDVMTLEFLNDIGATNIADAVIYSSNFGAPNDQNGNGAEMVSSTKLEARARSMDKATSSSDFFPTNLPNDLYNVERLSLAYGAQSVLFGLGNSGGVLDSATKRAGMKRQTSVGFSIDSWGATRTILDANQVLIPEKLSLRIVGLYGDAAQFTDGSLNRQKRIYGAATYRPLGSTTVRINYERMGQTIRRAANFLAYDFVTPWFNAGRPLFDNSRGNTAVAANDPLFSRNTNAVLVGSYGIDNPSLLVWNGTVVTKGPHQLPGVVDPRRPSLRDGSLFPTDIDPKVSGRENRINGSIMRGFIEQKVTPDLFFELGFNYEKRDEQSGGPFDSEESLNLLVDPNRYLPGGTAANPGTTLNPNAGKLYIETFPHGRTSYDDTKEARLTGFYEFDASRKLKGRLRWLGRHRLAALLSWREDRNESQEERAVIAGETSFTTGDKLNSSRLLRDRYYLDSPSDSNNRGNYRAGPMPGNTGSSLFGPWTYTDAKTGNPYQVYLFNDPEGHFYAPSGTKIQDNTAMGAWQGFFLKDRLNVFVGMRSDRVKTFTFNPDGIARGDQSTAGDHLGLFKTFSAAQYNSTPNAIRSTLLNTFGVVARPLPWLSVFYNKSENTALPPGLLGPFGEQLPGTSSHGYDYGIRFDMLNNRASLRLNFYEDNETDFWGNPFQSLRDYSAAIEQRLRGPDKPAGMGAVPASTFDPISNSVSVYRSIAEKTATGMDAVLVANLTSHWDLRLTVGRQHNLLQSRGAAWAQWIAQRLPVWKAAGGLGWDNVTVSTTDSRTIRQYYDQMVVPYAAALETAKDTERFREREWRANLFTNYHFTSEKLKGFNLGGGVRWFGPGVAGWGGVLLPGLTTPVDDPSITYKNPSQIFVDVVAGYRRPLKLAGARAIWSVQLNLRNLLNDYPFEVTRANWSGKAFEFVRVPPRQVILQTGLSL